MNKIVLILGNGFDLNLGLPTSYPDFVNSEECNILAENKDNYLTRRIVYNLKLEGWVDIEEELKNFAKERNCKTRFDKFRIENEFKDFIEQLRKYLERVQENKVNVNSIASKILQIISTYPDYFNVFSFNFTELNKYIRSIKEQSKETNTQENEITRYFSYTHIHGSIKEHSTILGFEDDADCSEDYTFMIKSFNQNYKSKHLRQSLSCAKEIIFFGHSLGSTDYPYFSEFFREKSKEGLKKEDSAKIVFITKNNKTRLEILDRLRNINNLNTNLLFDQNQVEFYFTSDLKEYSKILYFCDLLKAKCEVLNNLGS